MVRAHHYPHHRLANHSLSPVRVVIDAEGYYELPDGADLATGDGGTAAMSYRFTAGELDDDETIAAQRGTTVAAAVERGRRACTAA